MRWIFVGLVTIHGLIHFMGFGQAFGLGEFPQLSQPITRGVGIAWLAAGVLILATAVSVVAAPSIWWAVGFGAVLVSQAVIVSSWHDARFGTIANVVLLVGVVLGFASQGPLSFRAEYRRSGFAWQRRCQWSW